jgi:uncharacterized protein (TIGR02265 family)
LFTFPKGFGPPDDETPLTDDPTSIPAGATVKGFFFQRAIEELDKRGKTYDGPRRYTVFKDYPLGDYRELLLTAATQLYPSMKPRGALRRLGRLAYPTLAQTMIGRVIFGVLGNDLSSVMKAAAKGYKVSIHPGSATVIDVGDRHAHVRLEEIHVFVDCYQVGVFEGAIEACGRRGEVAVGPARDASSIELFCAWE